MKLRLKHIGLIVLGSIVALPVVFVIAVLAQLTWCDVKDRAGWGDKPFSAQEWQAARVYARYVYVDDRVKSKKLDGLSAEQVKEILGRPSHENQEGLRYLVKDKECDIDDWALDIDIEKGKVKAYAVRTT